MELIATQPGFKCCNEPLNLRNPLVYRYLSSKGISDNEEFYQPEAEHVLKEYFQSIIDGKIGSSNYPYRYRLVTNRIVFKIIHGCSNRINWFRDTFHGRVVYLLRHPIPTSLSRNYYPGLRAFVTSNYQNHFTREQLAYAWKIMETGSKLERGVLAWCLQNAVPLRQATDDWCIVSYEQLVIEPTPVMYQLAEKLALPEPERMLENISVPSVSNKYSDTESQSLVRQKSQRWQLVDKWRKKVSQTEEERAMEILHYFDLDVYQAHRVVPTERYWVGDNYFTMNEPG